MDKKRIMIVDDEVDFLKIMKIRLEASGYDVVTAKNGDEALEALKSQRPDAVLLDIRMPGIDGLEVLKRIRSTDIKLPVFIMTAFSNPERFALSSRYNASGFIVKTGDLKKAVENIAAAIKLADKYKG